MRLCHHNLNAHNSLKIFLKWKTMYLILANKFQQFEKTSHIHVFSSLWRLPVWWFVPTLPTFWAIFVIPVDLLLMFIILSKYAYSWDTLYKRFLKIKIILKCKSYWPLSLCNYFSNYKNELSSIYYQMQKLKNQRLPNQSTRTNQRWSVSSVSAWWSSTIK